jgi:hypothetical protein
MSREHPLEKGDLLFQIGKVYKFLNRMCTSFVLADFDYCGRDLFQNLNPLIGGYALHQFLTEIVSIVIGHHLGKYWQDLFQKQVNSLGVRSFKDLLQKFASALILSNFYDVSLFQNVELLLLFLTFLICRHKSVYLVLAIREL